MSNHASAENGEGKLDLIQALPLRRRLRAIKERREATIGAGRSGHANRMVIAARRAAVAGRRGKDQWTVYLKGERAIATEPSNDADVNARKRLTKGTTPSDPTYVPNQPWHGSTRLSLGLGDLAGGKTAHSWWSDDSSIDSDTADDPEPDPARFAHDKNGQYKATTARFRVAIAPEDEQRLRRHRLLLRPWAERKRTATERRPLDATPLNVLPARQLAEVIDKLETTARQWPNTNRLLDELVARLKAAVVKASLRSAAEPDLLEPTTSPGLAEPGYVDEDGAPYPRSRSATPESLEPPKRIGNPITWIKNGSWLPTVDDYYPNWPLLDREQHLIDQENPSLRIVSRPDTYAGGRVTQELDEILKAATSQIPERSGIRDWSALSEDPFRVPSAQERAVLTARWQDEIVDSVYTDDLTFANGDGFSLWSFHDEPSSDPRAVRAGLADQLGEGGQATCLKLQDPNTGTMYAVKLFLDKGTGPADIDREAAALTALTHENIIQFYSVERSPYPARLVLEFMNKGDIDNATFMAGLHSEHVWKMFIDILCGLEEMHKHGIIHHDLTPDNIMLQITEGSEDQQRPMQYTFKITDFGMMHRIGTTLRPWGKATFLPPELIYGIDDHTDPNHRETYGIDIWGLFAILMCFWDPEWRGSGRFRAYIPQLKWDYPWYARWLPYTDCLDELAFFVRYHYRERIKPLRPWSAMMSWHSHQRPMASELLEKAYKEPQYNFARWSDTHTKEEACEYKTWSKLAPTWKGGSVYAPPEGQQDGSVSLGTRTWH